MMTTTTTTKRTKIHPEGEDQEKPNPRGDPPPSLDRISELPVEILVHILGFLDMDKFLIGTSLVSTKWKNLWKSVSTLKFTLRPPPGCSSSIISRFDSGYIDDDGFVDHVLRLRNSEASKIQIFNYSAYSFVRGYDSLERLHSFIVSAANQGAQEIQINVSYYAPISDMIYFNPSIFTSGELRKFTFYVYTSDFLIQFPRSMCCATHLTHLSLNGIILPKGDDSNAELHLVCPLLEELVIINCVSEHLKVLDIFAPRLKYLHIYNSGMRYFDFDGLGGCRIEIRTPNLTSLDYIGRVYVDCFTDNLPHVANASLHIYEEPGMLEQTTSFVIKLLKGLTSAEILTLVGFEVFPEDVLKVLLKPFTSLTTLELTTSCKISSIHGMVHILNSCKNIEILVWIVDEICTVEGDDEHLMLPQCSLSHLKHVRIDGPNGHKNEIEFVKFLLKSSVVLEEIKIDTATDSPKISIEENLRQLIEEEPSIRGRSIKLHIL